MALSRGTRMHIISTLRDVSLERVLSTIPPTTVVTEPAEPTLRFVYVGVCMRLANYDPPGW